MKHISINDANDIRNARNHMKMIRDGYEAGTIAVSFDFRSEPSCSMMVSSSIGADGKLSYNGYVTGASEAGFLVAVKPDEVINAFDKLVDAKKYASADYCVF